MDCREDDPLFANNLGWDLGSFLDFEIDDDESSRLFLWDDDPQQQQGQPPLPAANDVASLPNSELVAADSATPSSSSSGAVDRVRKRDPRLFCENFLAGRVPCSCPEVDEKEAEEEEKEAAKATKKKRARTGMLRCQVPTCEADISELKGYHRRHRVCLSCAYAPTVMLNSQAKRYCQQCGKFHVLSDFDEGKRSCRRKLERHNNRRRRKQPGSKCGDSKSELLETEHLKDDSTSREEKAHDTGGKSPEDAYVVDSIQLSDQTVDKENLLPIGDRLGSPFGTGLVQINSAFENNQSESIPYMASIGSQSESGADHLKSAISPPFCDNKTIYSSACPTGRISFKLFDWNPAEFPRRLRLQIFEWLASMPVELEGYIRPGCVILTAFITMPLPMWLKLNEDASVFITELVAMPQSLLSGRGRMRVHLSDAIFQFLEDGKSCWRVNKHLHAPRLHYVHPTCFVAGKPMEFIACGKNLQKPKFRFLVSFAGEYLDYECYPPLQVNSSAYHPGMQGDPSEHEILKIFIPQTDPGLTGPAFIEVENESGLSNFIPVLLGDQETCYGYQMMEQFFGEYIVSTVDKSRSSSGTPNPCSFYEAKQRAMSDLLLDLAWLMKQPDCSCTVLVSSTHLNRITCLIRFLVKHENTTMLKKLLESPKVLMRVEECTESRVLNTEIRLYKQYISQAREVLERSGLGDFVRRLQFDFNLHATPSGGLSMHESMSKYGGLQAMGNYNMEMDMTEEVDLPKLEKIPSMGHKGDEKSPLLMKEVIMKVNAYMHNTKEQELRQPAHYHLFRRPLMSRRLLVLTVAAVALCCGICVVFKHSHKVWEISDTVRRYLSTMKRT